MLQNMLYNISSLNAFVVLMFINKKIHNHVFNLEAK
jgi:hypothetical protein